jgi:hypothetical protein
MHRDPKALFVDLDPGVDHAEVDVYVTTLVRWNGTCMSQPLGEYAAWRDIPVMYLHTTRDLDVPMDYQETFVNR